MQAKFLIPSKDRIKKILRSEPVDRIGIFDIDIISSSKVKPEKTDKFLLFVYNGPFQDMTLRFGLEDALIRYVQKPRRSIALFKEHNKKVIEQYRRLKDKGYRFDGVLMQEDIAYDKGLYFSLEKYRNQLFSFHREICDFFSSEGLYSFFHSDGGVEELIPLLVELKIAAVHPVQEACNPNLLEIKRDLKGVISFVGGVGLHRLKQDRHNLLERVQKLKAGGNYIFSFDGPVLGDISREKYEFLLRDIEAEGAYGAP